MRDHNYIDEMGNRTPISQLRTTIIIALLQVGVHVVRDDDGTETVDDVMERLRIELTARSLEG
jgi:hypothetical protein